MIKKVFLLLIVAGIILLLLPLFVHQQVSSRIFNDAQEVPRQEFAIILGAGINGDQPSLYLKKRLDDGIMLYKTDKVNKLLISGDNGRDAHDEISVMYNYLRKNGVPGKDIYGDYAGFDTYSTMVRAAKIFDIKNAVVITQKYHLPRSLYLAGQNGIAAVGFASSAYGNKYYYLREWGATIKSVFDCLVQRKPKYVGAKVDVTKGSNIDSLQAQKL